MSRANVYIDPKDQVFAQEFGPTLALRLVPEGQPRWSAQGIDINFHTHGPNGDVEAIGAIDALMAGLGELRAVAARRVHAAEIAKRVEAELAAEQMPADPGDHFVRPEEGIPA